WDGLAGGADEVAAGVLGAGEGIGLVNPKTTESWRNRAAAHDMLLQLAQPGRAGDAAAFVARLLPHIMAAEACGAVVRRGARISGLIRNAKNLERAIVAGQTAYTGVSTFGNTFAEVRANVSNELKPLVKQGLMTQKEADEIADRAALESATFSSL